MSVEMKSYVVDLLKSYPKRTREIALLHYELKNPVQVSCEEMIHSMALSHGNNPMHNTGHISDRTSYIAMNYQEKADLMNVETIDEIVKHLIQLEQEQNRLVYYISLLEDRQAKAIQLYYFEHLSDEEAAAKLNVSVRTMRASKTQAIDTLTDMYELAEMFH